MGHEASLLAAAVMIGFGQSPPPSSSYIDIPVRTTVYVLAQNPDQEFNIRFQAQPQEPVTILWDVDRHAFTMTGPVGNGPRRPGGTGVAVLSFRPGK